MSGQSESGDPGTRSAPTTQSLMLALSTSSGVAQVAACSEKGELVFSYRIEAYKEQSEKLLPLLNNCLAANDLNRTHFAGVAVNVGPGGFTSLRTACGVAQGLAVAWQLPCYSISSFECLVEQAEPEKQLDGTGAVLIDARLNEFYAEIGHFEGDQWISDKRCLVPQTTLALEAFLADVKWLIVDESVGSIEPTSIQTIVQTEITATALSARAWLARAAGRSSDPLSCQPLYVREKVADTTAERLARKAAGNQV